MEVGIAFGVHDKERSMWLKMKADPRSVMLIF